MRSEISETKKLIRAHKIRLRPTEEQVKHLRRACAAARNAWNWGKEQLDREYDESRRLYKEAMAKGEKPSKIFFSKGRTELKKSYNQIKPDWVKFNNGTATPEAFDDLDRAIKRYWDIKTGKIKINLKRNKEGKIKPRKDFRDHGWLNWRSIHKHMSFRQSNVSLDITETHITYNKKTVGAIRMCEPLRFDGKLMNATFSFDGRYWWASIQVEMDKPDNEPPPFLIGVDLGVKYLAYTSDGEYYDNPRAYEKARVKLRRLQRKLDRQKRSNNPQNYNDDGTIKKGPKKWRKSNRMKQTDFEILKMHQRIRGLRRNAQHQLTTEITNRYGKVAIEDLNVNGMLKNKKLSEAISDAGFGEMRRQFEYKTDYHNGEIKVVDQWFASSKICSGCGQKKLDLKLSDRVWVCDNCGQRNKRDLNAAKNLRKEAFGD